MFGVKVGETYISKPTGEEVDVVAFVTNVDGVTIPKPSVLCFYKEEKRLVSMSESVFQTWMRKPHTKPDHLRIYGAEFIECTKCDNWEEGQAPWSSFTKHENFYTCNHCGTSCVKIGEFDEYRDDYAEE